MYKENNNGMRTVPCGTPDKTRAQSDLTPLATTLCCMKHKEAFIHSNVFPPIPLLNNLLLRSSCGGGGGVGGGVKIFFKVQNKSVNLNLFVQSFITVVSCVGTTITFPECMLFVRQNVVLVQVFVAV